jgi:hypothetical protein
MRLFLWFLLSREALACVLSVDSLFKTGFVRLGFEGCGLVLVGRQCVETDDELDAIIAECVGLRKARIYFTMRTAAVAEIPLRFSSFRFGSYHENTCRAAPGAAAGGAREQRAQGRVALFLKTLLIACLGFLPRAGASRGAPILGT